MDISLFSKPPSRFIRSFQYCFLVLGLLVLSSTLLTLSVFINTAKANSSLQPIILDDVDILELSDDLKAILDEQIRPIRGHEKRTHTLHDLFFGPPGVGYDIKYNAEKTRTAQETFDAGRGNCISLSSLFVASARHVGLKAKFQTVTVPRNWEKEDSFYVVPGHINVIITLPNRDKMLVEFLGIYRNKHLKAKRISDIRALAEYHNNIGMEFLATRQYDLAIAHLEKSIAIHNNLTFIWSNLGVAYKKQQYYQKAEQAYLRALKLSPQNLSAIKNLYVLYTETKQKEKARQYKEKANSYAKKNPYHLAKLAAQHYRKNDFKSSASLLKKAIKKKPEEEIFHFQIAQTYFKQGKFKKAEKHLSKAENLASSPEEEKKYKRKLDTLKNIIARNEKR